MTYLNYTEDFSLIKNIVESTQILGQSWIIGIVIVVISLIIITRNTEKWKMLAFPVATMWKIIGANISVLILVGSAIMFVIEALSMEIIGNWLGVVGNIPSRLRQIRNKVEKKTTEKEVNRLKLKQMKEYIKGNKERLKMEKERQKEIMINNVTRDQQQRERDKEMKKRNEERREIERLQKEWYMKGLGGSSPLADENIGGNDEL